MAIYDLPIINEEHKLLIRIDSNTSLTRALSRYFDWFASLELLCIEGYLEEDCLQLLPTCPNLLYLDLSKLDGLKTLKGLPDYPRLKYLNISSTKLLSLKYLSYLPNLETIDISNTSIRSLSALKHCKLLKTINADGSRIAELHSDDISKNTIERIELKACPITQIDGEFPVLTHLVLSETKELRIMDIIAPKLTKIYVSETRIERISLSQNTELSNVVITHNAHLMHIQFASTLPNLIHLDLRNNSITNLRGLPKHCVQLTYINIDHLPIADLSGFPIDHNLHKLEINQNTDVSASLSLQGLPYSPFIAEFLVRGRIATWEHFQNLPNVRKIVLIKTKLSDFKDFPAYPYLQELSIRNGTFRSLLFLPQLPNLYRLTIRNCHLKSVAKEILARLPKLKIVDFGANKITEIGFPHQKLTTVILDENNTLDHFDNEYGDVVVENIDISHTNVHTFHTFPFYNFKSIKIHSTSITSLYPLSKQDMFTMINNMKTQLTFNDRLLELTYTEYIHYAANYKELRDTINDPNFILLCGNPLEIAQRLADQNETDRRMREYLSTRVPQHLFDRVLQILYDKKDASESLKRFRTKLKKSYKSMSGTKITDSKYNSTILL